MPVYANPMASLHKQPGKPNWFCAYTTTDGKRHFKSTGTTDKKAADQICRTWAGASLHGDGLTADRAREIIARGVADCLLAATGEELPSESIGKWCDRWLVSKSIENQPATHSRYELAIRAFKDFLGSKINKDLSRLSSDDVLKFRDACAKTHSVGTVNTNLRAVRACIGAAWRQSLVERNVAARVPALKERGENNRRALVAEELRRVLEICGDTAWRGLVLVGLYTGQRLGDCARLTWQQVDLAQNTVWFVTAKTNKRLSMHMAKPLADYLEKLPSSDNPNAPIFPRFAKMADAGISSLSNAFAVEIMIPAGLMAPRAAKHVSTGKGRTGRRAVNEVTFHSLRHSFTTMLKATGASNALAQMIVGHDSPVVSRRYTHLAAHDTKEAISKLPDVTR